MKRGWMRPLSYALGIVLFVGMTGYLFTQQDVLAHLQRISFAYLVGLLALSVLVGLVQGIQFHQVARIFGLRLRFSEWFGLTVTNTMLNYSIPLRGGLLMRAAYMRQQYGLAYTAYASLLASSQLFTILLAGGAGMLLVTVQWSRTGTLHQELLLLFSLVVVSSLALYGLVGRIDFSRLRPATLGRRLQLFAEGFDAWRRQSRTATRFAFASLVWIVIQGLRLYASFRAVGVRVDLVAVFLIEAVVVISIVVSVTPGNLGIKEGLTAFSAALLGIDPRLGLLASLVDRAAALVVTFGLGLLFSHSLLRELRRGRREEERWDQDQWLETGG